MAETYGQRPSSFLGLTPGSWAAYAFDAAVHALADRVDAEVERAKRGSPASMEARVRRAVARVLTTPLERELAERRRRPAAPGKRRRAELVWTKGPGDPSGLRVVVHEE